MSSEQSCSLLPAVGGFYGGIEGGATGSKVVLLNEKGEVAAEAHIELGTNHWQIGMEECLLRINNLTNAAKEKAGIDANLALKSLCMSLSGADDEESSRRIEIGLREKYPNLSEHLHVVCDTVGSIATASPIGGMVLIAGTGSNFQLINPNGNRYRCGGWGHMMGDEGSAYWITFNVLKIVFDSMDNLVPTSFDITYCRELMCRYFNVKDQMGMLEHLYTLFKKDFIAGMCKEIATGAREAKDPLCIEVFRRAGRVLAAHILALLPQADKSLVDQDGGVHVSCIGSVFKSWDLLQQGFLEGLRPRGEGDVAVKEITLSFLNKPASFGAAYLGAKSAGFILPADYDKNTTIFFHQKL